jgi:CopG family nickel-responsive transcriptional regulator
MRHNIIRFGVSIDENLLTQFDDLISEKGYVNRSEAIRDLIRDKMEIIEISDPEKEAIGTLSIVYSHDIREISDKLNEVQHSYHQNIISTTHIHLDHHNCLEVLILKGKSSEIKSLSDKLMSIKNVRNGKLMLSTP